jgi:hypothetical protein
MNNLAIFCADVGSIKNGNFGWAETLPGSIELTGTVIGEFASEIAKQVKIGSKVAIGYECPLFVPVRKDPVLVNSSRNGEGSRSWSAGAGTGALATGLVEVIWVFNKLAELLEKNQRLLSIGKSLKQRNQYFCGRRLLHQRQKVKIMLTMQK